MQKQLMKEFCVRLNSRFWDETWARRMSGYRRHPEAFAREMLGSRWWRRQQDVATAVATHRRTVVKSANGVGKTYLAADLVLWFLYTHRNAIVLTTAPTWRQVRHLLWEEIRRKHRNARVSLKGSVAITRLSVADGWYAMGLSTTDGVRFQGYHAEHMLIVFDEASGIPDAIWEAAEGVAVGHNNRILAIGNPLSTTGRFYRLFSTANRWAKLSISALEHPNVTGDGAPIPGAVTAESVNECVADWCCEATDEDLRDGGGARDLFVWKGKSYVPDNRFRTRVLGIFPDASDDTLIPLGWIEAATQRTLTSDGICVMAADVARFGSDTTVIGVRVGDRLAQIEAMQGADLMAVCGRICAMAYQHHPSTIAIDCIGLGAGVLDRLVELRIEGVYGFSAAARAYNPMRFTNRRAEVYWNLRELFRTGQIAIPSDEKLVDELAGIRYKHQSGGQICIERKEDMRKRGMSSPDRADMLAMLFDVGSEGVADRSRLVSAASPRDGLRAEMDGW